MATVNLTNVTLDPSLREATGDGANVDNNTAVEAPTVQSAFFTPAAQHLNVSAFEGTKNGSGSNVLSTPPPALGGGQANVGHFADAMARMSVLQNHQPFSNALMRSAEDGTAPAAPKLSQLSTQPAAQEPAAASRASSSSSGVDMNTQMNNVDLQGASSDLITAGAELQKDAAVGHQKKCNKGTSHDGEYKLRDRLQEMGMTKKRAEVLARFLNDNNFGTGSNHNSQDENTVALSIAAYDKLKAAGSKEAAGQVLDQLNTLADNFNDSTKTTAAADKYYLTMNVLGGYVMQVSANAAVKSLSSAPPAESKIMPYNEYAG